LRSRAKDRDGLLRQSLDDEIGHHATVIWMHARTIGVEYSRDLDALLMLPVIIEKERFGAALSLVITGAQANRIDVTPIIFGLRMDLGIPVDLAGGCLKDLGLRALCETQYINRAMHARLRCLHRIELIMNR